MARIVSIVEGISYHNGGAEIVNNERYWGEIMSRLAKHGLYPSCIQDVHIETTTPFEDTGIVRIHFTFPTPFDMGLKLGVIDANDGMALSSYPVGRALRDEEINANAIDLDALFSVHTDCTLERDLLYRFCKRRH